ncbi:MAG: hypothetical protein OXH63_03455, partial [Gemmatimonadetes bacterium]|nr:hypothetical protein [Gemmatimonadota bacterium]
VREAGHPFVSLPPGSLADVLKPAREPGRVGLFVPLRGYPVLVGVVTPVTTDLGQAEQAWPHWFIPFLRFLRHHPNIKAFTYIDWDWSQAERFVDPILFARYRSELMNPIYLHAASPGELRWNLNLDP